MSRLTLIHVKLLILAFLSVEITFIFSLNLRERLFFFEAVLQSFDPCTLDAFCFLISFLKMNAIKTNEITFYIRHFLKINCVFRIRRSITLN